MNNEADTDRDRAVPWALMGEGQDGYDVTFYEERFLRAAETVLVPLGLSARMLRDGVAKMLPLPVMQKQITAKTTPYYGPLFAGLR